MLPCGNSTYKSCVECPYFHNDQYHMDCNQGYDISDILIKTFDKGDIFNGKTN